MGSPKRSGIAPPVCCGLQWPKMRQQRLFVFIVGSLFLLSSYFYFAVVFGITPLDVFTLDADIATKGGKVVQRPSEAAIRHPLRAAWLALSIVAFLMTVWSYLQCAFTDPGRVPKMFDFAYTPPTNATGEDGTPLLCIATAQPCMVCAAYKPDRTHHCSVCGCCILRYDHHCPWMATCIGYHNMKFFLLFLFYSALYSAIVSFTLIKAVLMSLLRDCNETLQSVVANHKKSKDATANGNSEKLASWIDYLPLPQAPCEYEPLLVSWWTVGVLVLSVTMMLGTSLLLQKMWRHSRGNKTTIEVVLHGTEKYDSTYDFGVRHNLESIFGEGPMWRRWIPIAPVRPRAGGDKAPLASQASKKGSGSYGSTNLRHVDSEGYLHQYSEDLEADPLEQHLRSIGASFRRRPTESPHRSEAVDDGHSDIF
jgi:hypothetical protein